MIWQPLQRWLYLSLKCFISCVLFSASLTILFSPNQIKFYYIGDSSNKNIQILNLVLHRFHPGLKLIYLEASPSEGRFILYFVNLSTEKRKTPMEFFKWKNTRMVSSAANGTLYIKMTRLLTFFFLKETTEIV